jgi:hypothetical protein
MNCPRCHSFDSPDGPSNVHNGMINTTLTNIVELSGPQSLFAGDISLSSAEDNMLSAGNHLRCDDWPMTQCTENNVWRLYLFCAGTFGLLMAQTLVLVTAAYRFDDFTQKKNEYNFYAKQSHLETHDEAKDTGDSGEEHNHSISVVQHSIIDQSVLDHTSIEAELTQSVESDTQIAPAVFSPGEVNEGEV